MSQILSGCAVRATIQRERAGPFILVTDNDSHWYVIPAAKRVRWEVWRESNDDQLPDYAEAVGGSPCLVEFDIYDIR